MMRRGSRLLALVASVLFLIASASLPGKARADDVYVVYFPWVSNNETIGGQGPWSSTLAIHNLSNNPCPMSVYVVQTSGWNKTAQLSLNAASTRSIAALSLGVPKPGSPVRLEATCPIAASVKAFAPATAAAPWSDGAGIITGYTGPGGELAIPDTIKGLQVTRIGERAFFENTNLTSVTIPGGVTTIEAGAFDYCTGLTSVTIPNGVTTIGYSAFRYCTGLTSVSIPHAATTL